MSCEESQLEEIEVLKSIYEGDERFKTVGDRTFQYKVGETDGGNSFLIEFEWGSEYPNEKPIVKLDAFYNNHIVKEVKEEIVRQVLQESEQNLGCAMTYTLIEWAKENCESLMSKQPDKTNLDQVTNSLNAIEVKSDTQTLVTKERKTQLSKAQKRKMYDRFDAKGERPRGWDWVDIVKHLSQTGQAASNNPQPVLLSSNLLKHRPEHQLSEEIQSLLEARRIKE